ncbi:hypothetical protein [Amycolatopsis xylanica]|uniref:hypothetical protein n=1 Tax=Amycolatopsis xylanica TaxID=589385 RepID=UPI000B824CC5|nr:hypothetical protein [Amycolatopsis xylanica]
MVSAIRTSLEAATPEMYGFHSDWEHTIARTPASESTCASSRSRYIGPGAASTLRRKAAGRLVPGAGGASRMRSSQRPSQGFAS